MDTCPGPLHPLHTYTLILVVEEGCITKHSYGAGANL